MGGLLLFVLGALLTASYIRLRRRGARPADAVVPGACLPTMFQCLDPALGCGVPLILFAQVLLRMTYAPLAQLPWSCSRMALVGYRFPVWKALTPSLWPGDTELASGVGSVPASGSPRKPSGPPPVLVVQPDGVQVSAVADVRRRCCRAMCVILRTCCSE